MEQYNEHIVRCEEKRHPKMLIGIGDQVRLDLRKLPRTYSRYTGIFTVEKIWGEGIILKGFGYMDRTYVIKVTSKNDAELEHNVSIKVGDQVMLDDSVLSLSAYAQYRDSQFEIERMDGDNCWLKGFGAMKKSYLRKVF
jgi:hypothetical protein